MKYRILVLDKKTYLYNYNTGQSMTGDNKTYVYKMLDDGSCQFSRKQSLLFFCLKKARICIRRISIHNKWKSYRIEEVL